MSTCRYSFTNLTLCLIKTVADTVRFLTELVLANPCLQKPQALPFRGAHLPASGSFLVSGHSEVSNMTPVVIHGWHQDRGLLPTQPFTPRPWLFQACRSSWFLKCRTLASVSTAGPLSRACSVHSFLPSELGN